MKKRYLREGFFIHKDQNVFEGPCEIELTPEEEDGNEHKLEHPEFTPEEDDEASPDSDLAGADKGKKQPGRGRKKKSEAEV